MATASVLQLRISVERVEQMEQMIPGRVQKMEAETHLSFWWLTPQVAVIAKAAKALRSTEPFLEIRSWNG